MAHQPTSFSTCVRYVQRGRCTLIMPTVPELKILWRLQCPSLIANLCIKILLFFGDITHVLLLPLGRRGESGGGGGGVRISSGGWRLQCPWDTEDYIIVGLGPQGIQQYIYTDANINYCIENTKLSILFFIKRLFIYRKARASN
jgi:hypothetical protein